MEDLLSTLLQAILAVAVPILAGFGARFLNGKTKEAAETAKTEITARYIPQIGDAVTTAVAHVFQTYVDGLKKSNLFNKRNQEEAFNRAAMLARSLLTAEAERFIGEVYGDVSKYLAARIEAEIKFQK